MIDYTETLKKINAARIIAPSKEISRSNINRRNELKEDALLFLDAFVAVQENGYALFHKVLEKSGLEYKRGLGIYASLIKKLVLSATDCRGKGFPPGIIPGYCYKDFI